MQSSYLCYNVKFEEFGNRLFPNLIEAGLPLKKNAVALTLGDKLIEIYIILIDCFVILVLTCCVIAYFSKVNKPLKH